MEEKQKGEHGVVLIKKYSNRRLYDTRHSRYITLEDLAVIVQQGHTVKVVDANRGSDLTRQVLTQVILDQQERLDLIPVELLHTIIRTQGTMEQAPFSAFLSAAARQFSATGKLWAQQMAPFFASFQGFPSSATPGEESAESTAADDSEQKATSETATPTETEENSQEDLSAVRQRMSDLLERLK